MIEIVNKVVSCGGAKLCVQSAKIVSLLWWQSGPTAVRLTGGPRAVGLLCGDGSGRLWRCRQIDWRVDLDCRGHMYCGVDRSRRVPCTFILCDARCRGLRRVRVAVVDHIESCEWRQRFAR